MAWLPLLLPAGALGAVLVVGGLARMPRRTAVAVSIWIVVPLLAVIVLSLRNIKAFNVRYLAVLAPLISVLAARGAVYLRGGRWMGLAMLALALASLGGYYGAERYAREDLRTPAAIIDAQADADDVVLVPVVGDLYEHYRRGDARVEPFWGCPRIRNRGDAVAALEERIGDADRAWLVLCRSWDLDPRDLLPGALAELGRIDDRFDAPGVRVYAWHRVEQAAQTEPEPTSETRSN